jgi:hypothetical protein
MQQRGLQLFSLHQVRGVHLLLFCFRGLLSCLEYERADRESYAEEYREREQIIDIRHCECVIRRHQKIIEAEYAGGGRKNRGPPSPPQRHDDERDEIKHRQVRRVHRRLHDFAQKRDDPDQQNAHQVPRQPTE